MKNIALFYDEFPSDFHQPCDKFGIMVGTFIYHKGINDGILFNKHKHLFTRYIQSNELKSVSVSVKKTESISEFLKFKLVKYRSKRTESVSIYNTSNFLWCSICSLCFSILFKEFLNDPPNFSIYYDPKDLSKNLKSEFYYFLQDGFIHKIKKILNENIPSPQINIFEGTKKMVGIKIADKNVREKYKDLKTGNANHIEDLTKIIELTINKLLKVGDFSNNHKYFAH